MSTPETETQRIRAAVGESFHHFALAQAGQPEADARREHRASLMKSKDFDLFVSNQPNRVFLRNWREALELPEDRHVDTFDDCGNLFGAAIPINLDRAITEGRISAGDTVLMAAFAHAGDFAGAAAIRWGGRAG